MQVFDNIKDLRDLLHTYRLEGKSVGFVPTMGALHPGHAELIRQSSRTNDVTVVSIFVNPTQFNVQSDFEKYPRHLEVDIEIAANNGASLVFAPSALEMYPEGFRTFIEPGASADPMEGANRPGHFRGVATIVVKLLNIVQPDNAYFGTKDFQQLAVIRETVSHLNMPFAIHGVPTVREADGLALSSRNVRLSSDARSQAPIIYQALKTTQKAFAQGERNRTKLEHLAADGLNKAALCRVEYVSVCDATTLASTDVVTEDSVLCVAVWFDDVRLIDNIELSNQR